MITPTIFGCDPALTTGFGLIDAAGDIATFGHWCNKAPHEGRKAEDRPRRDQIRAHTFAQQLRRILDGYPTIERLAYEWVWKHTSTAQSQLYAGWRALLLAECHARGIDVWPVAWSTLKSVAYEYAEPSEIAQVKATKVKAERRLASKALIIVAAKRRWTNAPFTEDEADGLWVSEACRLGRGGGKA
ncbi:MAG: hypothetical protein COA94_06010 [Rickettsiales bacterium]|nr:MAG: hypothetical protein COA94_06010 [Rickettsiales bacterium]